MVLRTVDHLGELASNTPWTHPFPHLTPPKGNLEGNCSPQNTPPNDSLRILMKRAIYKQCKATELKSSDALASLEISHISGLGLLIWKTKRATQWPPEGSFQPSQAVTFLKAVSHFVILNEMEYSKNR